mmetsp:Transcript_41082/g.41967  ORF Transcript_41082/g.41967 Transcript_41082/m.41967 type:complete len:141 (+) Transcript_41082:93-515(+)
MLNRSEYNSLELELVEKKSDAASIYSTKRAAMISIAAVFFLGFYAGNQNPAPSILKAPLLAETTSSIVHCTGTKTSETAEEDWSDFDNINICPEGGSAALCHFKSNSLGVLFENCPFYDNTPAVIDCFTYREFLRVGCTA